MLWEKKVWDETTSRKKLFYPILVRESLTCDSLRPTWNIAVKLNASAESLPMIA